MGKLVDIEAFWVFVWMANHSIAFPAFQNYGTVKTILQMLEELRYQDALPLLNPLLHQARTFRYLVERIVEVFHPYVLQAETRR